MPVMSQQKIVSSPRLTHFGVWLLIGWLLVGLVVFLSLGPPPTRLVLPGLDKLEHFIAYFVLMMWFGALYQGWKRLVYALGLIAMGTTLEWIQGATALRIPEAMDMLANMLGVLAGFALAHTGASRFLLALERQLQAK